MRKIAILLLCYGLMFCSACNKAERSYIENQSVVSETATTEQVSEIPTEEEKESIQIESTPTESSAKRKSQDERYLKQYIINHRNYHNRRTRK